MKYAVNTFPGNVWLELQFHEKQSTNSREMLDLDCDFMEYSQHILTDCLCCLYIIKFFIPFSKLSKPGS